MPRAGAGEAEPGTREREEDRVVPGAGRVIVKRCDRCGAEGAYSAGSGVGDWSTINLWQHKRIDGRNYADSTNRHICPSCSDLLTGAGGEEHCRMLVEREYGWVLALVRGGGSA